MARKAAITTGLLLILGACSDSGGGTPPLPPTPVATTVNVSPSTSTLDALGATVQLTAQVRDQSGTPMATNVTWSSSSTAVATVSTGGLVTAAALGSTTITAMAGSASGSATITVDQLPAVVGKVSGDAQIGVVGAALGSPVTVRIEDSRGNPVAGEAVTFSVVSGGGLVDPSGGSTGPDGSLSASWTLGTNTAEAQALRATAGSAVADFAATAQAGPAEDLEVASGDGQTGVGGALLADPLVVRVTDAFGNGVSGETVTWSAATGNGTLDPATSDADGSGNAQTFWMLGMSQGVQTATAAIGGGTTVDFTATSAGVATPPVITGISPSAMVEGGSATLTGTNFASQAAGNTVLVDGVAAVVTAASTSSLTIEVPTFVCRPARDVRVSVTAAGLESDPATHPLEPGSFLDLDEGQLAVLNGQDTYCLQLPEDASAGDYLIGVQSVTEVPTLLTPLRVTATKDPSAGAAPPLLAAAASPRSNSRRSDPLIDPAVQRMNAHRVEEARLVAMEIERLNASTQVPISRAAGAPPAAVPDGEVGDSRDLRVRDWNAGATCSAHFDITGTVFAKTDRVIWFHDDGNPAGGFTQAELQAIAAEFEDGVMAAHDAVFGAATDLDNNGRIAIVITKEINKANGSSGNLQGFVSGCDFGTRTSSNTSSNEGEVFYLIAPDESGIHGQTQSKSELSADIPILLAHEITHIKQFGRRIDANAPIFEDFHAEGGATYAEEVVGHEVEGNQAGQNHGFNVAFNEDGSQSAFWYAGGFADLVFYFGGKPNNQDQSSQIEGAPEECSWLDDLDDQCLSRPSFYGVTWSLLRWIADQFYAGDEDTLMKGLIDSNLTGFALLEAFAGMPAEEFLPYWAATLYLDDREAGLDPMLRFTSWDLVDIFESGGLVETGRLIPRARGFTDFTDLLSVRGGSSGYFRVSGASQPATSLFVSSPVGGPLPSHVQVWVVKIP
jgi:hypothetical protein